MLCGAGLGCTDVGIPQNVGRCTDVEITPPSPRPPPARVRNSLPFTTIFLPEFKDGFCFFHELAFDSFKLCVLHPTFLPCRFVCLFLARYFVFFAAFKMGVKNFRTGTILCFSSSCHLLLLRHDIFVFATMPSFVEPRYFCFHHDAIFLLRHDTFVFHRRFIFRRFTIV
jgi:hypothetical protein